MESPTRGGPDDGSEITQRPTIERGKAQSGVVGETLFSPHGGERKGPSGDCTWLWAGRARASVASCKLWWGGKRLRSTMGSQAH